MPTPQKKYFMYIIYIDFFHSTNFQKKNLRIYMKGPIFLSFEKYLRRLKGKGKYSHFKTSKLVKGHKKIL